MSIYDSENQMGAFEDFFTNPAITLAISAALSVGLIPYFSSRWQIHQKGLEIRMNLIGRLSKTIMEIVKMIDNFHEPTKKEGVDEKRKKMN